MISNTSTHKLRATKSSRDINDYNPTSDNNDENGDFNRFSAYSRDARFNSTSNRDSERGRYANANSSMYRKTGERRGAFKSSRATSRRDDDNYYPARKYEIGNGRGKFYEPEKKIESKLNLPEDTRISKLLRRLNTEKDPELSLAISKKLLDVLLLPDNASYVRKAFHILGDSMYEILHVTPGALAKQQAARALGRMGYIMAQESDFERYQNWLFAKSDKASDEVQILLMRSFNETLAMEAKTPLLQNYSDALITQLLTAIEHTENADIFKATLEILVSLVELYPAEFYNHFRDTIDLLLGWHVDPTQPLCNIEFISRSLQRISHHFQMNLDFSVNLIENFLEDIAGYSKQIADGADFTTLEHVTVLLLALNTVLKCLDRSFKAEFVLGCFDQIVKTAIDALGAYVPDNLTIAANDSICILLGAIETKPLAMSQAIFKLVDLELTLMQDFADATIVSMLLLIAKVVKELGANLPVEFIAKLIGPKSEVIKLRYSPIRKIQDAVICVYQALLNLKNVGLLQEAYKFVLGDLEVTFRTLTPDVARFISDNPFSEYNDDCPAELTVLFLLRCLSQLANASSIIVMWALKPSFLELIGVKLRSAQLALQIPELQYSLLYLLYSHCKCYNHFISNSELVSKKTEMNRFALTEGLTVNDVPISMSPNSGNFAIILDVLYETLNGDTLVEVAALLLQWLNDILVNAESYLEKLYDTEKFVRLTKVVLKTGYNFNATLAILVSEVLAKLLQNKQLIWRCEFLNSVADLCKLHMNSNDGEVQTAYAKLSAYLPWDVAIREFNKINTIINLKDKKQCEFKDYNNYMIYMAQHLHLNGTMDGELYPQQFKTFMNYLLKIDNEEFDYNLLQDLFVCCWSCDSDSNNAEFYYDLALSSAPVLENWATLEAAQFCVNYKLRTPLGKPNETFTKIEGALNQLGNDLMTRKQSKRTDLKRVAILLQFVEHLEKSIYNATEGCAVAMPQTSKLVRSFFMTNTNTCNEWLNRIRMVVMHTALHSGESNIALRHGFKDLQAKIKSPDFEKVLIFVTMALLNLRESEALRGLYAWTRHRFAWIKCAADQAAKRYELALDGYKEVESSGSDVEHFVRDQIEVCYKELNDLVGLFDWHAGDLEVRENGRKYWFSSTDWECSEMLYQLEDNNDLHAYNALSRWDCKTGKAQLWSVYDCLATTENNLYKIAISLAAENDRENWHLLIDDNIQVIQDSVKAHLNAAPSGDFLQSNTFLHYVALGLKNVVNRTSASTVFQPSSDYARHLDKIDGSILRKVLWWTEYFNRIQNPGYSSLSLGLRLDVIKRCRKESNTRTAFKHVVKFFKEAQLFEMSPESDVAKELLVKLPELTDVWTVEVATATLETIKLTYLNEASRGDAFNLCAMASTAISKYADMCGGDVELKKISSKILQKLAIWLQCNEVSLMEMNSPLGKLIMVLPEIGMDLDASIPMNEMAVGKLLQFSVNQCVGLAKSWNNFGTWCYRWGKKIVDHSYDIKNNLTEEHCEEIKRLLPVNMSEVDLTNIYRILSKTRAIIDEEDIESNEINTTEMIESQLRNVEVLKYASEEQLRSLVQIWRSTQNRLYNYYALAADAYFKYLHLASNPENLANSTECSTITITLRLLRLIVKYALELQNILEDGLQTTPTQPWKIIIPQLFSRLNHPEGYVRLRVSDLLCRVAEDAPQLITFPAVVGALEGGLKFDFSEITLPKDCLSQTNKHQDEELNEDEDNYESDNEETNTLQTCFKTMVETLSKQDPETIAQVQMLVKELRRITLLWHELWLGTLLQHQSEINKRQQQLEFEIEKVNDNTSLTKEEQVALIVEKHRIIIKPIVFFLEQLQDVTSVEAETPHEKMFQERYLDTIKTVISKLKNPDNPEKPAESLAPLKQLQKRLQASFSKRAAYNLKMQNISPVLAQIKNTAIAMPGLAATAHKTVTIAHVSNVVSVLPTKTKPKKLVFYGSDGQTYTYLFKGMEDLHLDERIMQFLNIANTMMAQNKVGHNLYRARHYSVIPLGPRSGLISWVDGTTPVFALYKRWQQRESAKPTNKNVPAVQGSMAVLRPSELFYNKLNPLLREHGVKNIENRKEWPVAVLKQVLTELMAETPSDLLTKELWCNSISAGVWWQVVKRYSYSVAVMSMIGYIIGLGDRHLDNVLVDLTTGDVVHIDYNVCFEKGKTLRVPEKVPFRFTPNIRDALGVTGVEGIFRLASADVLKTMRKGKETLLTLLKAFVYDPLIDWTVGGEVLAGTSFGMANSGNNSRQTKKELEKEVTLSMFNVRCTEMKAEWQENKDEILTKVEEIIRNLIKYAEVKQKTAETGDLLQDLHQQLALVKEAEAQGQFKHTLYLLPSRYDAYNKTQNAMNKVRQDFDAITSDCNTHLAVYGDAWHLYEQDQFTKWLHDGKMNADWQIFELIKEFLQNAGKVDFISKCEASELEMAKLAAHLNQSNERCLQLFQKYYGVLAQCPTSYLKKHRVYLYPEWTKCLLETRNLEVCDVIYEQLNVLLNAKPVQNGLMKYKLALDVLYKETVGQINKQCEDLEKVRAKDGNATETVYANAKLCVDKFLGDVVAENAFEFVIASELVLLNQAFLALEIAAHRSGNWLIKLTSRDGDWFLDDLLMNSHRAVELIANLPLSKDDERFAQIALGIKYSNSIYKALYELHYNFHTIILPEGVKRIQSEDESVQQMIAGLNELSLQVSIPDVIAQLEKTLTCIFMQMEIGDSYQELLEKVSQLRRQFAALIQAQSQQGQMLLMGFNGLFEKLNQEMGKLIAVLGGIDIPDAWRKLDQVKEAKSIAAHIFNSAVRRILDDIFLLKKLQTMQEVFALSGEMYDSKFVIYNDEVLVKPVKQYIADFISRQLLGLTTENIAYLICAILNNLGLDVAQEIEQKDVGAESKVPMDELYHKAWTVLPKKGVFTPNILAQASSLETNLKLSWEALQEPKRIEQKLAMLKASAVRLQSQITVANFMYDASNSDKWLADFQAELKQLQAIYAKLQEAKVKRNGLIEKAHQRLNWAKGANPNVGEIKAAFQDAIDHCDFCLTVDEEIGAQLLTYGAVIVQHEVWRSYGTMTHNDKLFVGCLDKWRSACQYTNSKADNLTATEENIMNMLTPDLLKNHKWLQVIGEQLTDVITATQMKLEDDRFVCFAANDALMLSVEAMKVRYNVHTKLMAEVKSLIKTMAKIDEYSDATHSFIATYRAYIENFSNFFKHFDKPLSAGGEGIDEIRSNLVFVRNHTSDIYDGLMGLQEKRGGASPVFQLSPITMHLERQEKSLKGQQRNAYAVGVWRRVKMKLEGRDPDPGRKFTPQEQVDYVIREATSLDNLALLYEGWTPWV